MVMTPLAKKVFLASVNFFSFVSSIAGPNFPQIIEFRNKLVEKVGVKLVVGSVEET